MKQLETRTFQRFDGKWRVEINYKPDNFYDYSEKTFTSREEAEDFADEAWSYLAAYMEMMRDVGA